VTPLKAVGMGDLKEAVDASSTDDLGEMVTIPSLPEITDCHAYERAPIARSEIVARPCGLLSRQAMTH
jgi:hypothetical protein